MPTYPLPTLAATVSPAGISAPPYADVYDSLRASFQSIYGADAYIDPDSQDGQMLAVFAKAQSDANDAAIAAFRSFSPATGFGDALSSNVKINGIARGVPTNSQVTLRVTGQVGATVTAGQASDAAGNVWDLPAVVVVPVAGFIDVTATAVEAGAIAAATSTITRIVNPQLGWQAVTNTGPASLGAPVESDAALRRRQAVSTGLAAGPVLGSTLGAILNLPGVTRARVYENDTDATNANGQPEHSIAAVVVGGVAASIANAILVHKTPGAYTYGSTAVAVTDPANGMPYNIRFTVPAAATVTAAVTIKALPGYTTSVGDSVKQAVVDYVNATEIGGGVSGTVEWDGAVAAAKEVPGTATFKVTALALSGPGGAGTPDVPLLFNQVAAMVLGGVTLTVT